MKKKLKAFVLVILLLVSFQGTSHASGWPVFDAVNAMLGEMRNVLMQSQFAQDLALSMERLQQLKSTYQEMLRFNAGFDDFLEVVIGNPLSQVEKYRVRHAFDDFHWMTPTIEILEGDASVHEIRNVIEKVTGEIPNSEVRPYIPFEEMQVVEGFQFAQEIRKAGKETREAAHDLATQVQTASPKGAAKLGVEAMSQILVSSQANQEVMAKMIELQATQIEQVSREEKRYEYERLKYMDEFKESLQNLGRI